MYIPIHIFGFKKFNETLILFIIFRKTIKFNFLPIYN